MQVVRLSALHTSRLYSRGDIPAGGMGDQTHDLPACSAVPQPTAPPPTPLYKSGCTEVRTCEVEHNSDLYSSAVSAVGLTFKSRVETHPPFAGIIRSSPYIPR